MGILAVVNQKGGVGKTTVALGLASASMMRGRRSLVVDMDPQANATTGLGVFDAGTTTDEVLADDRPGAASDAVRRSGWEPSVGHAPDLVPSSPRLAQREHQLATDPIGAQDRLEIALSGVAERYDDVIIDCPPSLGLLTVNALFAADRVLIVAEPAAWSLDGVEQILRNVRRIAERQQGRPEVAGIVVNRLGRTRDAGYWFQQLQETHGDLLLEPAITMRAAVTEAAAQSMPIHLLRRDGASEAGDQFAALARALDDGRAAPAVADLPQPRIDLSAAVGTAAAPMEP
jgi:chromosome partitioning protein